jgi:hypothetical protein
MISDFARCAPRRLAAAIAAAAAGSAALTATPACAELVIDLRAVTLNGQPLAGGSTAERVVVAAVGDQVGIDVYAVVSGANAVNDEAFQSIHGSFFSSNGGLLGDLVGATVAPFNGSGSTNGVQIDHEVDGDLDVGPAGAFDGEGTAGQFFIARSSIMERDGAVVATDPAAEEFRISTLTWTAKTDAGETFLNFKRRLHPSGNLSASASSWQEDGTGTASVRNGLTPYTTHGLQIVGVPEPGSVALASLASLALLRRRRRRGRGRAMHH